MDGHRVLPQPSATSSAQTLYYYNVDAILSELIRPATPKHGNLARPRLVKPEPIRPQQLAGFGSGGGVPSGSSRYYNNKRITAPFALLNDRTEGARNPDPIQQQVVSPFAMDNEEEEDEDTGAIGMTYSNGVITDTMDHYYNSNGNSSKRSRDDEDILYYKKSHNKSITTNKTEDINAAALVTPNPIQYYTSVSQPNVTLTNSLPLEEPQFIVYKNFIDDVKTESSHNNYFHHSNSNSSHVWTTTTPSTSVSYTIVKPIAMRPMDVIQHLDHHYHHHAAPSQDANSCTPLTKNLLYTDVLDDGSMQVCG